MSQSRRVSSASWCCCMVMGMSIMLISMSSSSFVQASESPSITVSAEDFFELQNTIARLEAEVQELQAAPATQLVPAHGSAPQHARRSLATTDAIPALSFEHPNARIKFASGSTLYETEDGVVHTDGSVHITADLHVDGSISNDGSNLNLGTPLMAAEDVVKGDIVSLSPSGGVAKGYGMQLSSILTSMGVARNLQVLHLSDSEVVYIYIDANDQGVAVYHNSGGSSSQAPVVFATNPVHICGVGIEANRVAICYREASATAAECVAALYTGELSFGTPIPVPDSDGYQSGAMAVPVGSTDRVVLIFSMVADDTDISTEQTKTQVMSASGASLSALSLPRTLMSSKSDNLAAVALTSQDIIVTYRVTRDANSEIRHLYFLSGDTVNLLANTRFNLLPYVADLQYMSIDRLTDKTAIVAYRDVQDGFKVYSAVADITKAPLLVMHPAVLVDSGTESMHLEISVAAVSATRVGFAFLDASAQALFVDAGLFGTSIVVGRPQSLTEGSPARNVAAASIAGPNVIVVSQIDFTGSAQGATVRRATMFGGPTMLGLAKTDAMAGDEVTVVLNGALDGYSGLRPGAPYYARFDGGIGANPDVVSGTSTEVVGKAVTETTLLSLIGADGETNKADIAALRKIVAGNDRLLDGLDSRLAVLEDALQHTPYFNKDIAVFRWAVWSTYSQAHGTWYASNNAAQFGGVNPSSWGDGNAIASSMSSSKEVLATMFNKKMTTRWNANVWAEEWYSYSSTNSRHVATLFRIRNKSPDAITWPLYFYYSSYGGWNEYASVAMNGVNQWSTSGNCGSQCTVNVNVNIPGGRTSTVIVVTSSGSQSSTRSVYLGFYNNCLKLPTNLEYVDDLDTNTSGWEG